MSAAWACHSPSIHRLCSRSSCSSCMGVTRSLCKVISLSLRPGRSPAQAQEPLSFSSRRSCATQMESNGRQQARFPDSGIVVANPAELERKKRAIRAAGMSSLQVIADFDMTLTKYMVDGSRGQSTHALLNQGNAEYDRKRQELFDYYYPLETCPSIPVEEKTKLMEQWWGKTHTLLVEGGLTYHAIEQSVKNAVIKFREGVIDLLELLEAADVPVLIFSAGLADIIEEVMRQKLHRTFKNIRVVSNRMDFDPEGNLLGFKGKLIHVLNKNEHSLEMAAPLHDEHGHEVTHGENGYSLVRNRRNVLLLGDHIGDLGMSDGVDYDTRITVGFLNENIDSWLNTYCAAFDIVVLKDGSMSTVVELVHELSSSGSHRR